MPRRRAVLLGGVGLMLAAGGAVALVAVGAAVGDEPATEAAVPVTLRSGLPLVEPPVVGPRGGVTRIDLTAKTSVTRIAGSKAISAVFNELLPSPTLRVGRGQRLAINLRNENPYGQPNNLHTHGLHVDPKGHGDNVFVNLPTNRTYEYRYDIPRDHIPGLYWYHPHRHRYTDPQVFAGQAGAIIIPGGLDDVPGVGNLRDRLLVYQTVQIGKNGRTLPPSRSQPKDELQLINGQLRPVIDIRPGETQRWRILNASSDAFLRLRLNGHSVWTIADDGNPRATPTRSTVMFMAPGERREILVRARSRAGSFTLESLRFAPVPAQPSFSAPDTTIATMRVAGAQAVRRPIPQRLLSLPDLRRERVVRKRTITYSEKFPNFFINGRKFNPNFVAETMKLNTTEEWTVRNTTDEWHTFHIHVNPYQRIAVNGKPVKDVEYDDDVALPPRGSITMRTRFTDFTGKFVIHCHVLFHEDSGMMAAVQVVR
jgi:FtsP/CotA-like multicopper oxidase with cupredoxin domain